MSDNQQVKLTMLMLLALLLLSHGVGNIRCSTLPDNSTDMLALLDFRAVINDARGALTSWNTSVPYCKWRGITCNPKNHGRVTAVNLTSQGLSGPIAASVGNLTLLHTLDLSSNQFFGQIPNLSNLQKMQVLKLNQNSLNGTIPDTITNCSNLKELHLESNSLEGAIPRGIGYLNNLVFLGLSYNNLTGTIPPTVGNITHLEQLYLGYNHLEGSIPDELGKFSKISIMDLPQNKLSGSIPESLFNLSSLQKLGLNINQLSKSLPNDVGNRLSSLQILCLSYNMLEGHIPDSLGNASMLQEATFQSNNINGQIPSSFGRLPRLSNLNLQQNMLEAKDGESWEFLQALGNCSMLQRLQLADNQLQGLIPNSVGNLPPSLQYLTLGGNNLSGAVPPSIGNLSALLVLALDDNNLTGNISGHWIPNLNRLLGLYLSSNNFSGPIPASIGTLTNLIQLFLDNNGFDSPIPQSLWNLGALKKLNVSYNNLQGNISPEVGNLKQLLSLDISSNKLSGEIPDTLGQCTGLTDIQMNQNLLTGSIPASFGKLESLSLLNLSHNTLSGTIPTSLGNLSQLGELDLSYNHLQGQIPTNGIFKNASAVSLEENWGLCGEVGDLGVPSCPSVSRKISRQYYLIRILIPIFGFMSILLLIYFLILEKKVPRRKNLELTSFGEYFLKVSYNDLAQATKNFAESNLIGRGSCGSVYRGTIKESKIEVAVKVFNLEMPGAERSFMAECEALRSIQHRNLLPITTACSTVDITGNVFKALVYEFMPNGNLDSWLHHKEDGNAKKRLGLTKTISIAANIADALDYLHHDCGRPTVHCDVKPSNILLDEDMDALLGDFGIARFYADSRLTSPGSISSIGVKGTIGYIAPEYAHGGHASTSGDAYSFGIVLLEMMTGKRPTDPMFVDGFNLVKFVESNFPHQIYHIIDTHLKEECNELARANMVPENVAHQCLASLLQVALSCAHPLPSERANMKEAASKMHAIKTTHLGWKSKK